MQNQRTSNNKRNRPNHKSMAMVLLILSVTLLFSPKEVLAGDGGASLRKVLQEIVAQDWQEQQQRGLSGTLPMRPTVQPQQQVQPVNCAYAANPSQCFLNQGY